MRVSISRAWDETRTFLGRERSLITPIVLAFLVVPTVAVGLIEPSAAPGQQPAGGPWVIAFGVGLFVSLIGQLAIMRLALGWEGRIADVLRYAFVRIWTVLGSYLILAFFIALLSIPLVLVAGLAGGAGAVEAGPSAGSVSILVIAFIFVIARFVPMSALAIDGSDTPWGLLKRCWTLTRGSYWRLLSFFLVFLLGSLVLGWAVNVIAGLAFTMILGPAEPLTVSRLLISLAEGLVQGGIQSVYAVMVARIAAQFPARSISAT